MCLPGSNDNPELIVIVTPITEPVWVVGDASVRGMEAGDDSVGEMGAQTLALTLNVVVLDGTREVSHSH